MSRALHVVAIRHAARSRVRRHGRGPSTARVAIPIAGILSAAALATGLAVITAVSALRVLSADLPDPARLATLTFAQPSRVLDREGKVELGRFQRERRTVLRFETLPRLVLDATTTAEDRTFWENPGIDPAALLSAVAENASGESQRGASTITQLSSGRASCRRTSSHPDQTATCARPRRSSRRCA